MEKKERRYEALLKNLKKSDSAKEDDGDEHEDVLQGGECIIVRD